MASVGIPEPERRKSASCSLSIQRQVERTDDDVATSKRRAVECSLWQMAVAWLAIALRPRILEA